MHFFKNLADIEYIKKDLCENLEKSETKKRFFIGCFDIPNALLQKGKCKGFYTNQLPSGCEFNTEMISEYAIESSQIKEEYLIYFKQESFDDKLHWKKDDMDKEMK